MRVRRARPLRCLVFNRIRRTTQDAQSRASSMLCGLRVSNASGQVG